MSKANHIVPILRENYLYVIASSVGAKQFRKFYIKQGTEKKDIMRNGELSCAYFVSSILASFNLIDRIHGTVNGTVEVLEKSGWKKIKKPKEGCLLIWEKKQLGQERHKHIGFYVGNDKAISNSSKAKVPKKHHWTFGTSKGKPKRKIIGMYWNNKLN